MYWYGEPSCRFLALIVKVLIFLKDLVEREVSTYVVKMFVEQK